MILVSPQYIDLLVPQTVRHLIRKDKIVAFRLFCKPVEQGFETEHMFYFLMADRRPVTSGQVVKHLVIILCGVGRQILKDHLSCVHNKASRSRIDKAGQFAGVSDYPEQPLLLPYGIGNICPGQAYPAQPQVNGRDRDILGTDVPVIVHGIGKRIGLPMLQPLQHAPGIKAVPELFPVPGHHPGLQQPVYPE